MTVRYTQKYANQVRGINTEAALTEFPEGFVLDENNFNVTINGAHRKRPGLMDVPYYQYNSVPDTVLDGGTQTYFWEAPDNYSPFMVVVFKQGAVIKLALCWAPVYNTSFNNFDRQFSLGSFRSAASVSESQLQKMEVSFTQGDGDLYIVGEYINPIRVTYDRDTFDFNFESITIQERDYIGIEDGIDIATTPEALSDAHFYNLLTRGWDPANIETWHTDAAGGNNVYYPSKNMIHYKGFLGKVPIDLGGNYQYDYLASVKEWSSEKMSAELLRDDSAPTGALRYNPFDTTLVRSGTGGLKQIPLLGNTKIIGVDSLNHQLKIRGYTQLDSSLSATDVIRIADMRIHATWDNNTVFPKGTVYGTDVIINQDVELTYVDHTGPATAFYFDFWIDVEGKTGDLLQGGDDVPGTSSVSVPGSYLGDPTVMINPEAVVYTTRFKKGIYWQGRMWYGGATPSELTNRIYFSQIADTPSKLGLCMTAADPTSDEFSEPVATDGGVIVIPEMRNLKKFIAYGNSLLVLAENGVWRIGPGELGIFSPLSYTLRKITSVGCVSDRSVVIANNVPYYWSPEGIVSIEEDPQQGFMVAQNLTLNTINSLISAIPNKYRQVVKGAYDSRNKRIVWLFNGVDTRLVDGLQLGRIGITKDDLVTTAGRSNTLYYDHALVYDLRLGSFTRQSFLVSDTSTSTIRDIAGVPDQLITNDASALWYVTRKVEGTLVSYKNAVLDDTDTYTDFGNEYGFGAYRSFIVSGPSNMGDNARQRTAPYVITYFREDDRTSTLMSPVWDLAATSLTGKVGSPITVYRDVRPNPDEYKLIVTRNKIRGRGRNLFLLFESLAGTPCWLEGWQVEYNITEKV